MGSPDACPLPVSADPPGSVLPEGGVGPSGVGEGLPPGPPPCDGPPPEPGGAGGGPPLSPLTAAG
eukprot:1921357-Alexandrium_andersonii.AAC.1